MRPRDLRLYFKARNRLGEGAFYDRDSGLLYWVDVTGRSIHSLDREGRHRVLPLELEPGFVVPLDGGGLIVGGDRQLVVLEDGKVKQTFAVPDAGADCTVNDGKADRSGRFLLFGTSHRAETSPLGRMYAVGRQIDGLRGGFTVFNGPAFSPGGEVIYFTDSPSGTIWSASFEQETGRIGTASVFARVPARDGFPDGMTVDAEGCLWSAHWDGWRITRYRPDGSIDEIYELPVQRPTSLVFTGPALRSVVVTSAAVAAEPEAGTEGRIEDGDLLAFDAEVAGLACPRFDFGGFD